MGVPFFIGEIIIKYVNISIKGVDFLYYVQYNYNCREEVRKKVVDKIKKVGKVIEALTDLALKIGTLLAVIKMVLDSLK